MGTRLENAPVFYTVAQIRHNPILKISNPQIITEIQDKLRKIGYSDYQTVSAIDISLPNLEHGLQASNVQPIISQFDRHIFANKEATKGFVVDRNAVTFQTTNYNVFESFSKDFMTGLEIMHECIGFDFVSRVGIRYLDAVHHPEGESSLYKYLQAGVHGITKTLPDNMAVLFARSETQIATPFGNVLARVLLSAGELGLPPDLQLIGVKIQDRFKKISGVHAVIDTDASIEERISFVIEDIAKKLDDLHVTAGTVFKSTITEEALAAWA